MHGIGVSTPSAAAVAAATIGLASDVHIPNGGMLTTGGEVGDRRQRRPSGEGRLGRQHVQRRRRHAERALQHRSVATAATLMFNLRVSRVGGTADTGGGSPGCTVPALAWATTEPVTEGPLGKTNTQMIVRSLSLFQPVERRQQVAPVVAVVGRQQELGLHRRDAQPVGLRGQRLGTRVRLGGRVRLGEHLLGVRIRARHDLDRRRSRRSRRPAGPGSRRASARTRTPCRPS